MPEFLRILCLDIYRQPKSSAYGRAYKKVEEQKLTVTDEAGAVEVLGEPVRLVEWRRPNIKITTPEDLPLAAAEMRIV